MKDSYAIDDLKERAYRGAYNNRLRRRFVLSGVDVLYECGFLALFLNAVMPRRDVKSLAQTFLAKFGSLSVLGLGNPSDFFLHCFV